MTNDEILLMQRFMHGWTRGAAGKDPLGHTQSDSVAMRGFQKGVAERLSAFHLERERRGIVATVDEIIQVIVPRPRVLAETDNTMAAPEETPVPDATPALVHTPEVSAPVTNNEALNDAQFETYKKIREDASKAFADKGWFRDANETNHDTTVAPSDEIVQGANEGDAPVKSTNGTNGDE